MTIISFPDLKFSSQEKTEPRDRGLYLEYLISLKTLQGLIFTKSASST